MVWPSILLVDLKEFQCRMIMSLIYAHVEFKKFVKALSHVNKLCDAFLRNAHSLELHAKKSLKIEHFV